MTINPWIIGVVLCFILIGQSVDSRRGKSRYPSAEARLVKHLLGRYGDEPRMVRPVLNSSEPLTVRMTLSLVQILDINEKEQMLSAIYWMHLRWEDQYLMWDPADFDDLVAIGLLNNKIWLPDIRLYNRVDRAVASMDVEETDTALVYHNGTVVYIPSAIFSSSCPLDMTDFPFDTQTCSLHFSSWIYDSSKMDQDFLWDRKFVTLESYIHNSEWTIDSSSANRSYENYDCCLKPYASVTFYITMKRKATMHMKLIVLPTALLTIMTLVIFCIPAHRPDRIGLSMSLFSSFFLLLIMGLNISPPTSKSKLGQFWCLCIIMVTCATMLSVVIINLLQNRRPVPVFIDKVIIKGIGYFLLPCIAPPRSLARTETLDCGQKWQLLGLVIDRILFIVYFIIIIYVFSFVFPGSFDNFSIY